MKQLIIGALALACISSAYAWSMNPDGSYSPDDTMSYMTPDGRFTPGESTGMNPNGTYSGSRERSREPTTMRPNRSYGYGDGYMRPDGSYGSSPYSEMTPNRRSTDMYW